MNLILHRSPFLKGLLLLSSFVLLLWVMMLPLFKDSEGNRQTSLQYADTIFNELSKGSSFFIPQVLQIVKDLKSTNTSLSISMPDAALANLALLELQKSGLTDAQLSDGKLSFHGNLAAVLHRALDDSAYLYDNDGEALSERYENAKPLDIARAWWHMLNPAIKELQKQNHLAEAAAVEQVVRRAIEPANNFYGLPTANVAENALLLCALLAFYVLYAIWYGFAIYNLFDGFGLLGKK